MNRDDVLRMAREAGSFAELAQEKDILFLHKFSDLIASHVAEECANKLDEIAERWAQAGDDTNDSKLWQQAHAADLCQDAIRSHFILSKKAQS